MTTIPLQSKIVTPYYFCSRHLGQDRQLLVLQFGEFQIGRYVSVRVSHSLAPLGNNPKTAGMTPGQQYAQSKALKRAQQQYAGAKDAWIIPGQQLTR